MLILNRTMEHAPPSHLIHRVGVGTGAEQQADHINPSRERGKHQRRTVITRACVNRCARS